MDESASNRKHSPLLLDSHREFIGLLNKHQVEYMIVGGVAVNLHGYTRGTGDLDILFSSSPPNKDRLVNALESFGYQAEHLRNTAPDQILMFALGERNYQGHIELTNRIARYTFEQASSQMQKINLNDLLIPYIGYQDLVINKQAAGRPRDLDDVTQLQKIHQQAQKALNTSSEQIDFKAAYTKQANQQKKQTLWQKVKQKISHSKGPKRQL